MSTPLVEFARPPVRRVKLVVRFDTSDQIRSFDVGELAHVWRDEYPEISERPPYTDGPDIGISVVNGGEPWPIPFTRYADASGRKSIGFQGDRFEVSWDFDDGEDCAYPGYLELREVLLQRFEEFSSTLERSRGIELTPSAAECFYENAIANHSGRALVVGLASNWTASLAEDPSVPDGYLGYRAHHDAGDADDGCSTTIAADSTSDGDVRLSILSAREQTPDGELTFDGLMDVAHESLIRTFVNSTPGEWHLEWGRVS